MDRRIYGRRASPVTSRGGVPVGSEGWGRGEERVGDHGSGSPLMIHAARPDPEPVVYCRPMASNRATFDRLLAAGEIDIAPGPLFGRDLAPLTADAARVEGMLLGLAIGDALGRPASGMVPDARRRQLGEVRDYLPNPQAGGRAVGLPSDETQLAFWTLEQLVKDGGLRPQRLMARLAAGRVFGIGPTTREALEAGRVGALPWERCGLKAAGSGALPRTAPLLLPHLAGGGRDLWIDVSLATLMTHNDSAALAAGLGWAAILWQLLAMDAPPAPDWWGRAWLEATTDLEVDPTYRMGGPAFQEAGRGTLGAHLARALERAEAERWDTATACAAWGSSGYLLEALPSVLWILSRHAGDPEAALVRAVNDTEDSDRIAALVGTAVGALHGRAALPERWVQGLLGRTGAADDGQLFRLLAEAVRLSGDRIAAEP